MKLAPKNWSAFQHYAYRLPPWIKLHRALLDDRQYQRLPIASRALAPMLWLLASESAVGVFDASVDDLAFRLRMDQEEVEAGLKPLIDAGFFVVVTPNAVGTQALRVQSASEVIASGEQAASNSLASCSQVATSETETETETEAEEERANMPRIVPRRNKAECRTLAAYLASCKAVGAKPISDDHFVRQWAADAGLQEEMLQIAWVLFRERYTEGEKGKGKRYKDWPGHFATAVKGNWFRLWFAGDCGMAWTSTGLTHKKVLDERLAQREADHAPA